MIQNIQNNIETTKKFMKSMEVKNMMRKMEFKQFHGTIARKPVTKQLMMRQKKKS